ncbi:uracil-DNA glycosylase family protein [Bacillus sp. V5-8f]|uniref:uracil-DNA glycosylase family protein n=1 Tax=Bacillus sp. V5-8f TaxID=2053044 RepID=UPI000C784C8F|nr:uracil-DNA glycosylase family protein [Bacillus sp. V5-8f]PLT31985.1 hypothetical protein CUU64_20580 [Bacillus sp. V5-8f]
MRTGVCPECGSKMIEDAFEEIKELANGSIQLDPVYPAWVCSSFCGYYEKIDEHSDHAGESKGNRVTEKLKKLNFDQLLKLSNVEASSYSFDKYRKNGKKHIIEGFCTSCEKKEYNYSKKSPEFRLSTISHGTHTNDFIDALKTNKPDVSSWHEEAVMFIFESPSGVDKKYTSITYNDVAKKPTHEWYWIHNDKEYAEFPQFFERGKHYGRLVHSMINTFKLKNAYVTNLVKCGLNNEKGEFRGIDHFSSECINNCFENFLKQEINIVQPKVIFSFSKSVKRWVEKLAPGLPVYYLPHPAGREKNKVRKLFYFWELTQGLYDTGILSEEEVSNLALKYINA